VGDNLLDRTVSWACSLRPSPPAFPKLDGNEIALIDMDDLRRLDAKMPLSRVVRSLENARIAAIAVLGPVDSEAIQVAQASRIALFQLGNSYPLVQTERAVIRLIVDRAGYITQRSAELQRELNQIALDGGGIQRIADHITDFVQQPLILLREDGQVATYSGLNGLSDSRRQGLISGLPNITSLRSWAASQPITMLNKMVGTLPLNDSSRSAGYGQVVVSPIVAVESIRGYCLLLRPQANSQQSMSAVEEIAVSQGAASAALEWAKQNAVGLAEERMRAAFVDELLASEIADEQAWIQRGASLSYDLTQPHVAWVVEAKNVPEWPAPLLRFIQEQDVNVPISRRDEGMLLFWPHDDPKSGRSLKGLANQLAEKIVTQYPKAEVVIGIGRPGASPSSWLQSQQQARESWRLGKEWKGAPVTYFGDLGLYQLLTTLGNSNEAGRFYRKTLGRLLAYDESKNAELVQTLEAFFECHGNLSQTAAKLHIHRNTLTYRLEQISTITQLNLDDPDARFSLQFSLKLRPVVRPG
ncbi:MAG: helix-turn-helix domain-containing protein, partial [Caldilineaceae bacterium]|nr:helix-turn-helix domain-containing protein [Caldilineaceae bacterium]